ncbi:MAG: hypothetical protein M1840_004442 [Geoglossum simile]|nr:MAG: hypothetical protein M1840_004442 [Geoglossum simile]
MAQPNFGLFAKGYLAVSQQLSLCTNMPAINRGAAVLARLDLANDMAGLRIEIDAMSRIGIAPFPVPRQSSSLVNPRTGVAVFGFPATSTVLGALTGKVRTLHYPRGSG